MAITTLDQLIGAAKQTVPFCKTAAVTTVATGWFSTFAIAGNPGAGTLAGASAAAGVVPDDSTTGSPTINAFGAGATGYLSAVDFGSSVACRMQLFDMVFKAGAYSYAAGTTTLSAQPSYSARMPGGSYVGTQIWMEVSTAFVTGTAWQVQVTYTNQAGTTGRTSIITVAAAAAALTVNRMYQIPLQAGDTGVQAINSVIVTNGGTAMTAGAFNILVLRPLWMGRCKIANDGDVHGPDKTGLPVVFDTSCIVLAVAADSTSSGIPELQLDIVNG